MTDNNTNTPSVGIRPWGTTPKKPRQFDDDVPRLEYLRYQPGLNNVRIVTGMGTFYQVRWKGPDSKRSFGDKIRTAFPTYGEDCPVKKYLGLEGKERYMVVVIHRVDKDDRSKDVLKLMDVSPLTAEQIETNLEVKNSMRPEGQKITPRDFDISVKFDPKSKTATGFYSVVAHDAIPLSENDLALIEDIGGEEVLDKILGRAILCPKPETVIKNLKKLGWTEDMKVEGKEDSAETEETTEDDYSFQRPASDSTDEDEAANG
jgi:hypothetical protein